MQQVVNSTSPERSPSFLNPLRLLGWRKDLLFRHGRRPWWENPVQPVSIWKWWKTCKWNRNKCKERRRRRWLLLAKCFRANKHRNTAPFDLIRKNALRKRKGEREREWITVQSSSSRPSWTSLFWLKYPYHHHYVPRHSFFLLEANPWFVHASRRHEKRGRQQHTECVDNATCKESVWCVCVCWVVAWLWYNTRDSTCFRSCSAPTRTFV